MKHPIIFGNCMSSCSSCHGDNNLHRGYGGWVAPNIYYLGYSGAVQFGGLCIAGLSGIYKYHDYERGHFEMPPYNGGTVRSTYHVRKFDVFKLKKVSGF